MKKLFIAILAIVASTGAADAAKPYTNLYDKVPGEGYVGSVALEIKAPGYFGNGGSAMGATTTHGWMVTSQFFAGLGAGYIHDTGSGEGVIPIFAEGRYYFTSQYMRRIYPHIGLRAGGQVATEGGAGFYSQLACGVRVPVSEKLAITVEVGPQYSTRYQREGHSESKLSIGTKYKSSGANFSFFGRIGLEF